MFLPTYQDGTIFLPLEDVLGAAGLNVIVDDSIDGVSMAFATENGIIRLNYTEDQQGNPVELKAQNQNGEVFLTNPAMLKIGETVYFSAETLEDAAGIISEVMDAEGCIYLDIPLPDEE